MSAGPISSPATQIVIQERSSAFGRFGKWLLAALVVAVIACISLYSRYHAYFSPSDAPQEKYHSLSRYALKKIAIIDISGAIMDADDGFAKKQIDRVREDENVVAAVVRIDSPGGTVTSSDYLYHHLRALAKERNLPLVVSMGSVCASGGYYIAMAAGGTENVIYAEPTTWTGSIGVIIPHFDVSTPMSYYGVRDDSISSGPYKQLGTPFKRMTTEEREILQTLVDDSFSRFKQIVLAGRPKLAEDPAALDAVATGQIFTASQAVEKGLVDKEGFIESAIARAAELASVGLEDVRCVKYEERPTFMSELIGADSLVPAQGRIDLAAIAELATPRPYYLWTWLPSALSSSR